MASQKTQKASRWGFLSQAVASVEAGLDTILAEDDESNKKPTTTGPRAQKENVPSGRPSAEHGRSGASTPANDRLQARLAHAMVKKTASRPESPAPAPLASNVQSTATDDPDSTQTAEHATNPVAQQEDSPLSATVIEAPVVSDDLAGKSAHNEKTAETIRPAISINASSNAGSARVSTESRGVPQTTDSIRASVDSHGRPDPLRLQSELEAEAARQDTQNELVEHLERIDALQNKLRDLSKVAERNAKEAATAASSGSVEKQLAERDEKIALLFQEGTVLQKSEMALRQTIKKLRNQVTTSEKGINDTKQRAETAERNLRMMEDRASRAESAAKRAEQSLASMAQSSGNLDAVTREKNALNATLAEIRAQLSRANARADAAEGRATAEQLQKERKKVSDLQDDINNAKVERELAEEKLNREIKDLRASLQREKEHTGTMENEMLGEQAALESKLEAFRARAEEASSSDQGDVQAKLLRQIETLQSQYAAASQNWQGIEANLLGRITTLEKERDEVVTRETDLRRKLRDATSKSKRAERERDDAQNRLPETEKQLGDAEEECQRFSRKIKQLESDLAQARTELEDHEAKAEQEAQRRVEEEKAKWTAAMQAQHRTESPVANLRKSSGLGLDTFDRPGSRRSSAYPGPDLPHRQQSLASLKGLINGGTTETPSIVTSHDPDEYFNNVPPTPASQGHNSPRTLHDLMSTSTVGAGPSVQLVERMSANVRRLESEKAASKDEIARLTSQRDGSRQEVVNLMREVEEKRNVAERLKALEDEHRGLSDRYQTTLELLGERSEQVEELKADILDVKQMYRQLADTMGK
jgi:TATA element modulatory factor